MLSGYVPLQRPDMLRFTVRITPIFTKSLHQSKINGDIVFGTWANFLMHFSDFLSGHSLEEFDHNVRLNSAFILASGDTKMIDIFLILTHSAKALQVYTPDNHEEEARAIQLWEADEFYPGLAWYAIIKAQTCLLKGEFEEGLEYCSKYVHVTSNEVIMFPKIRFHFIRALLLMSKKTPLTNDEQELLNFDLDECESLSTVSPVSFKFGKLLLKAEHMKEAVGTWEVAHLYDEAIKAAQESKNSFYVALGGLCASRFWGGMFFNDLSRFYLNEAIAGLNSWGAYEIVAYLSDLTFQAPYLAASNVPVGVSSSRSLIRTELANFQTILDAFYAISRTLNSTELLNILMQKILENATASRAILILKEGDEYYTKATIDFSKDKIEQCGLLLQECPLIPHKIIQYALNTDQNVLVDNPIKSDIFSSDSYIQTFKPASCAAITSSVEGVIYAVLYLENESIATPLNKESIRTLELLLTHATIILKNTLLYESLAKNSEELNKAQEIAHLGSWIYNASTGKVDWSAEVYRIYEIVPFSQDINMDWFVAHLHPDDAELVHSSVEKALNGNRSYNLRHRIITAMGNIKFVHQKAQVYWEGNVQKMSGTIQDVTDTEEAKAQISRLNQVVDQNPFSTIITDTQGVIEYVNHQALIMTGYFEHELIGKKMSIFSSGVHTKKFYGDLWDVISIQKQMWRGTIINSKKNGENLDCLSTIFPILGSNNEVINFVTIQEDVTQKNIKDKLFVMQTRQAQMGEMLSMIAHQWRQPLSVISALMNKQRVDIALEQHTVDGFIKSITDVDSQVQYLSRTISDFRDFFKPDKEKTSTTTANLFNKVLGLIGRTLKSENIETIETHQNDQPYLTYEHEMVQVILNLFKNAQDTFIERNISDRRLIITSDQNKDQCIIMLEDNALGIDQSVIDTLFLPYISTKNNQNGTGLGLYMSKTIVEEHCKGSLQVENTQNGAKFTIILPIKDSNGTL
jgi:PAS domain S-box-containing protein